MDSGRSKFIFAGTVLVTALTLVAFLILPLAGSLIGVRRSSVPARHSSTSTNSWNRLARSSKIHNIERQTSGLRQLRPLHSVRVTLLGNSAFNHFVSKTQRKGESRHEIRISKIESVITGLIGSSVNLRRIVTSGLSKEVVGLYDRKTKRLYVRNSGQALGIDRWTVAHEYTHALQDQHFHLKKLEPDQSHRIEKNSDADLAAVCLVEGDAVHVQYAYLLRYYTNAEKAALQNQLNRFPSPPIPKIINEQFEFPYTQGPLYISYLLSRGGYRHVDSTFRHPPRSTFQIMFPEKSVRFKPLSFRRLHGFSQWKVSDDDVDGAFGYKQLVEKYVPVQSADRLAALWRGDRYLLLARKHKHVMFMDSAYPNPRAATLASDTIAQALATRFGRSLKASHGIEQVKAHGLAAAVRRSGSHVYVVYGPNLPLTRRMVRARAG